MPDQLETYRGMLRKLLHLPEQSPDEQIAAAYTEAAKKMDDLSTPESRRRVWNEKLDQLMRPTAQGGQGMTFNDAVQHLRETPDGQALLRGMGYLK
jgi:hypothetical protein